MEDVETYLLRSRSPWETDAHCKRDGDYGVSEGVNDLTGVSDASFREMTGKPFSYRVTIPIQAFLQHREQACVLGLPYLFDIIQESERDQCRVNRHPSLARFGLHVFPCVAFRRDVEIPDPLFLLHIGNFKLRHFLPPCARTGQD